MIQIPQPALALNSHNVPQPILRMWNYGVVPATNSPDEIMGWIQHIAASAPGRKLKSLVLNCHGMGRSGQLGYGLAIGTGIFHTNVHSFNQINGMVETIYITACGASHIARGATAGGSGDGHYLISSIAREAGAMVVASTELQLPAPSIPTNFIDSFEGLVTIYNKFGHLISTVRNPSTYRTIHGYTQNG